MNTLLPNSSKWYTILKIWFLSPICVLTTAVTNNSHALPHHISFQMYSQCIIVGSLKFAQTSLLLVCPQPYNTVYRGIQYSSRRKLFISSNHKLNFCVRMLAWVYNIQHCLLISSSVRLSVVKGPRYFIFCTDTNYILQYTLNSWNSKYFYFFVKVHFTPKCSHYICGNRRCSRINNAFALNHLYNNKTFVFFVFYHNFWFATPLEAWKNPENMKTQVLIGNSVQLKQL